jgi:hypothetical protein
VLVQSFGLGILLVQCGTASYVCEISKAGRSWHGWLGETLKLNDAKVYLKLAISSTVMTW